MVTHRVRLLERARQIAVLENGRIAAAGPAGDSRQSDTALKRLFPSL
jgi:ATP-binding cassette subfamily C protein CydC